MLRTLDSPLHRGGAWSVLLVSYLYRPLATRLSSRQASLPEVEGWTRRGLRPRASVQGL